MLSGRRLDLANPSPVDVEIEDIAHGLARVARWNGQTKGGHAFSVAEHSVVVENLCRKLDPGLNARQCMTALLHDSPEYVIGDMISPFKALLGESYKSIEARLQEAIHIRFELAPITPVRLKRLIKKADHISAWFEAVQLAGFSEAESNKLFGTPPDGIRLKLSPKSIPEAQDVFLARYSQLHTELEASARR
ncbi:HD domain-containing protein [Hyphomonas johnsonii MHS-2]|uniref:HD domain-containing protein n=2 Tax=Hyphomonas johnsonii TaxID=81031 RepID=A0A059FFM5_9PROT|nr:HD domain-containing protein [Hyphomonas johnsonii MHS-2]